MAKLFDIMENSLLHQTTRKPMLIRKQDYSPTALYPPIMQLHPTIHYNDHDGYLHAWYL